MKERWVTISTQDRAQGLLYVQRLELLVPGSPAARNFGSPLERPSLVCNQRSNPFVITGAGQVLEAPKFAPSRGVGIQFEAIDSSALTNGSMASREIERWSWVAFLSARGPVYTKDEDRIVNYRYAKSVKLEEIRAYCFSCLEDSYPIPVTKQRDMGEPLKQGLAVERYPGRMGEGSLGAICSVDKHPVFKDLVRYNFKIGENGEFILRS